MSFERTIDKLVEMQRQLDAKLSGALPLDKVQVLNERVHVHVPGIGLLLINEVDVQKDYCTEELQEKLEGGWRIIACCPQPDQRRPDYILGRTTKETNEKA